MPQLIKSGELVPHDTQRFLPLEDWQANPSQNLLLNVDDEPLQEHTEAAAIAIDFGAFNDGRGLSLAVLLRTRLGYQGEIRAVGDVHHDLMHYLVRCGFSSFELPEERDVDVALRGAAVYSRYYQASVTAPCSDDLKKVA